MQLLRYMVYIWEDYELSLLMLINRLQNSSEFQELDLPEDDISDFTEQVKERNMAELFENFVDDIGLIPKLKIAREKYLAELRAEVQAEVRADGSRI